ncbi:MAG: hypothetical protein KDA61_13645, partial [Planctomycetales bacterium]|nr:hypothetical protein [Planctomycetales bacterium]
MVLWFGVLISIAPWPAQAAIVHVTGPGRYDWVHAATGRSHEEAPPALASDYHWKGQAYEFFAPSGSNVDEARPLILFVSPENRPKCLYFWQTTCERHGALYAEPRNAGNAVPFARRVRIALDVLDDVQRRHRIDPQRVYLAGFSGGATVAQRIAFRMPEHVAGLICIGQSLTLPDDPYLRQRAREDLSVALVCGRRDPIYPFVKCLDAPTYSDYGGDLELIELARLGHTMPPAHAIERAYVFLDSRRLRRRPPADQRVAVQPGEILSSSEEANQLLEWARRWIASPVDLQRGVAAIDYVSQRWVELPEAAAARELRTELSTAASDAVRLERSRDERLLLRLRAEGLQRLAEARIGGFAASQQPAVALEAVEIWKRLLVDAEAAEQGEIRKRIDALANIAEQGARTFGKRALESARFRLVGEI